jgi:hypothetical protein
MGITSNTQYMKVRLTIKSSNQKTGPIPVSTTHSDSCPAACPMKNGACYAKHGPLAIIWKQVESVGLPWGAFCEKVSAMPEGQLWRHNQAGDLPGVSDHIDRPLLDQLVAANTGRRGFTYTHKPVLGDEHSHNQAAVAFANRSGFTINLSANNLGEVDALADLGIGPVAAMVPEATPEKFTTPDGRRGVICPAQTRDNVSCATCQLCSRQRSVVVGFRTHGSGKNKAEQIAGITTH